MATLTLREYNPITGAFIGNVSAISFGKMAAGTHSQIKVMDVAFTGVESVANVQLGLINSGGITVNPAPLNIAADGSASNGAFGVMHSAGFNPVLAAGPLTQHFAGLNQSGAINDADNVTIGTRDDTTSQFFYLDIQPGSNNVGVGAVLWKIFFDFA